MDLVSGFATHAPLLRHVFDHRIGFLHPKGEWSDRAQWWVDHAKGKQATMASGIDGQWIYLDVDWDIAIIKQSSQPVSKDTYLNRYDLNGLEALVDYLSKA